MRPSLFGARVDAIEYLGMKVAQCNENLRPKQEKKLEAAKVCLCGKG